MTTSDEGKKIPAQTKGLLEDAQLVTDFASRAGLLEQPNDPLIDATHSLRMEISKPDGVEPESIHLGNLYVALSKAVKAISPYVSLSDLRNGYSPFNEKIQVKYASSVLLVGLFFVSFILTVFLIQRLQINLTLSKQINQANQLNLDDQISNIGYRILDGSLKKPDSDGFHAFQESINKAKAATNTYWQIGEYAKQQDSNYISKMLNPFVLEVGSSQDIIFTQLNATRTALGQVTGTPGMEGQPKPLDMPNNNSAMPFKWDDYKRIDILQKEQNECTEFNSNRQKIGGLEAAKMFVTLKQCIVQTFNFSNESQKNSILTIALRRTMEIYILTAWLLPLCAGLLGASVYLIYTYYFDQIRPLGSLSRIILRFILGGIGGVIVGWFYSPARYSGSEIDLIDSVKQFPFMFAFLAGFSSEYAFSYLSKLIAATRTESKSGAPQKQDQ